MSDNRSIGEFHESRVSGSGCPGDENGRHYFAFIDPLVNGRLCIDCGEPEGETK